MQRNLITIFTRVLENDEGILQRLRAFGGDMYIERNSNTLLFKLSALHKFCADEIKLLEYKEFRKLLYQGNLNEELAKFGGRIDVHQSKGNVDDNWYKLVTLNDGDDQKSL